MRTWPALELASPVRPELFEAALSDFTITAIDESSRPGAWQVGFTSAADRDAAARALTRQFPDAVIRPIEVSDDDWVARSQAALTAVQVGGIVVAPPWDVPDEARLQARADAAPGVATPTPPLVVVIRPSMGFGTGHHASTRLCLSALQQVPVRGRTVVDVGSGSGVLAIAASRLGASRVVAIDSDPDAIDAAAENLGLNPGAEVTLCAGDLRSCAPGSFDIVLANLTGALLRSAAANLRALAGSGACLILGGFLRGDEQDVLESYGDLAVTGRAEEEEWLCLTLQYA